MRASIAVLVAATLGLGVYGCGGAATGSTYSGGSSLPAAPTPPTNAVVTIDIAEINGPNSFYPSPSMVNANQTVVWRNSDVVTHHVVFDDGSLDTGTLAPGTLSQPKTIAAGTGTYHCTIHPTMVGTVVAASGSIAGARPARAAG